jgi:hypothetical protein
VLSSSRIVGVVATGGSNSDSVDSSGMLCCETRTDSLLGGSIRSVAAVPFDDGLFVKIGNNWSEFHSPQCFFSWSPLALDFLSTHQTLLYSIPTVSKTSDGTRAQASSMNPVNSEVSSTIVCVTPLSSLAPWPTILLILVCVKREDLQIGGDVGAFCEQCQRE